MKKISLTLALVLVLSLSLPVSAFASNKQADEYYQEKGQINLSEISKDLYVENNEVKVLGETSTSQQLLQELERCGDLEGSLANQINNGNTPVAIGYTRVYLKEVAGKRGNHLEPMTVKEVEEQKLLNNSTNDTEFTLMAGDGNKNYYQGKLSLYTSVFAVATNKYCATSHAQWESTGTTGELRPTTSRDFISITAPSNLGYISSSFGSLCNGFLTNVPSDKYWQADQGYTSVIYGYIPVVNGQYSAWLAECSMICNGTISGNGTFISKYVHSYATYKPSFSISKYGVSFSTEKDSWQLASSVNY